MTIQSDMQQAEKEIREIIETGAGAAMASLMNAYSIRNAEQRKAFVAVLIGRISTAAARQSAKLNR